MRSMMADVVTLVKPDGQRFEKIRANVQPRKIFIDHASVPLEEGDRLERVLPNNLTERYLVLDRRFYSGSGGIPDHYQADVRKESAIPRDTVSLTTIYNLHGSNSRININSNDRSTNVLTVDSDKFFNELRTALQEQVANEGDRDAMVRKVDELEGAQGSPEFAQKYAEFVALAADHMTLLAPFIPALTQLLT